MNHSIALLAATHKRGVRNRLGQLLALTTALFLAGCGNLNQVPKNSLGITSETSKPTGYIVTLNITNNTNQTILEQRYGGKALVFDPSTGFAMLNTKTAPDKNDPAVQSVQANGISVAPDPQPAQEVGLDGSTSWGGGIGSWSNGIGSWGSSQTSWGSGQTTWGSGGTSWGSGGTSWGSGTVVPALPIENQAAWNQIKLYEAHRLSRNFGGGIKIAVIDSGIDLNHSLFAGKLVGSPEAWDYVGNDPTPQDEAGGNGYGHGTAVAGIILQVAPRAKILPIRVLRPDGTANTADVVAAIGRAVYYGANIINLSLGTGGYDQSLMDICTWANNNGVRIVAAAGNNGQLNNLDSPALFSWSPGTYQMTIGVGSVNANDQRSSFSSYGDNVYTFAPGENIWSAYPGNQSATFTGTSFAAPIVSGSIALMMSEIPDQTKRKNVIRDPATNNAILWGALDWPTSLNISGYWRGRINLENFVRNLPGWTEPTDIQSGVYQIANVNSGKCLDVKDQSTANYATVQQWGCNTIGDNQKWRIESLGAGLFKLKAMHSGRVLSIGGVWANSGKLVDGAPIVQWDDITGAEQKFYIQASGTGYVIKSQLSNKCLDIWNWSTADGQALQQWACTGTAAQQFKLKALF
jgi:thermitase